MTTERVQIIVSSKGAVTVKKDIDGIGNSSRRASQGVDLLKGALTAFISGAALRQLATYSDEFINIRNRLALVTDGTAELNAQTQELLDIANTARTDFGATVSVYQRTQQAVEQMGVTAAETTDFMGLLTKSVTLSGASSIEATNALRQLSQGLASGELRGEEFRSVSEQLPYVLSVLGESLGKTTGQLRDMAFDGQLTPQLILEAFRDMRSSIEHDFQNVEVTIGQALTVLNNQVTAFVGGIASSTGVFSIVAQGILLVANNLDLLAIALSPVALGLSLLATQIIGSLVLSGFAAMGSAITQLVVLVRSLATAFLALNAAILTNPIALVAAGITSVIILMYQWRDSLGVVGVWFEKLLEVASYVLDTIKVALQELGIIQGGAIAAEIKGEDAATKIKQAFSAGGTDAAAKLKDGVKKGAEEGAAAITNAADQAAAEYARLNGEAVKSMGKALVDGGEYFKNEVTGEITKAGEEAAGGLNTAIKVGGDDAAGAIKQSFDQGSKTVFNSIESAFATLAPLVEVFEAFRLQLHAQLRLMNAQAAQALAEAKKARAEAEAIRKGAGRTQVNQFGNNDNITGLGVRGGGGATVPAPNFDGQYSHPAFNAPTRENPEITIQNIIDPEQSVAAIDTAPGNKAVVNVIKGNREEIQRILGVV